MTVNDYKTLENGLRVQDVEVGFHLWSPEARYTKPFEEWSTAQPPLKWYSDYNDVKHNRNTEFNRASLENLLLATSGLFCLLARNRAFQRGQSHSGILAEVYFQQVPFSVRGVHTVISRF